MKTTGSMFFMADEIDHFSRRLDSGECREALAAFFEHRPPDFSSFAEPI